MNVGGGSLGGAFTIRPFASLKDYEECTDFQEEIWGEGFSEKVSAAILMIANRLGGLAAGAYDESGVLQGFVFGLTGMEEGELVHWSDMLAVREAGRDLGLGTRLKWYQRREMLARGVRRMRWTFDPLQSRNAHVNFAKLGVVSREYVVNMYGITDSPLHRGMDTDRLVATWELDSPRVEARFESGDEFGAESGDEFGAEAGGESGAETGGESGGEARAGIMGENRAASGVGVRVHGEMLWRAGYGELPRVLSVAGGGALSYPGEPVLGLMEPRLLVAIPSAIDGIMDEAIDTAIRWREATRAVFTEYLGRGYEVTDFFREESASFYLLSNGDPTE